MSKTIRRIAGTGVALAAAAALALPTAGFAMAAPGSSDIVGSLDVLGSLDSESAPENGVLAPEVTYKVNDDKTISATISDPNTGDADINCVVGVFEEGDAPTDGTWALNTFNEVVGGNVEGQGWAQTKSADKKLTTAALDDGTYTIYSVCADLDKADGATAADPVDVTVPVPDNPFGSLDFLGSLDDLLGVGSSE